MIGDTATGIDERLGAEYGDYARKAASAIDNAASSLASKSPDELIDDTRDFVKKSPGHCAGRRGGPSASSSPAWSRPGSTTRLSPRS